MWFVYILLCEDGSFYTGVSNDVEKRFAVHQNGKGSKYTRSHKPLKILHQESFPSKSAALRREHEIKRWPRQKKIDVLGISDDKEP